MDTNSKKSKISYIAVFVIGAVIGFFGVLNSVFSDGSAYERSVTILVVLIAYAITGVITGFIKTTKTMLYLPCMTITGLVLLLFYMYREFNVLHLVYFVLILIISYLSLRAGRSFTKRKNNK